MRRYMLDTDICSYAMKQHAAVRQHFEAVATNAVCISAVVKSELLFGVEVSGNRERNHSALEYFLQYIPVLDYPQAAAVDYAAIRAALQRSGRMIGPNDLFIAAHARSLDLTLVTNNVREFGRVAGLRIENWAESGR